MEQIQKKAIETYQNNLKYLELNDKELHDRIQGLSMLIEHGEYKERYHLEYIKEDKNFDIYDTLEDKYLYDRKTSEFNKQAVKVMNLDKLNTIDMTQHTYYNKLHKYNFNEDLDTREKALVHVGNDIFDYTSLFRENTKYKNKKFKSIQKLTFIGTLLGSHIPLIGRKFNNLIYFISEANLEIFRLSLFVTDYAQLANGSKMYFSVMDDDIKFKNKFFIYLMNKFNENYMIKYYSSNYNISNYFDRIISVMYQYTPFKYTYTNTLYAKFELTSINNKKYPTLTNQKKETILKDKQVLLLAAGPSFGENIEWIKQNQNYFFIIAIGATLIKLINNDIIPNLITTLDSGEHTINHFPDSIKDKIKNIPLLASTMTHYTILKQFNQENVFLYEASFNLRKSKYNISGYSIGEVSYDIASILGANNIYLLGTDLALHQETGSTHDKDYKYNVDSKEIDDSIKEDNSFFHKGGYSLRENTSVIRGNKYDKVVTTTIFLLSIKAYTTKISKYKKEDSTIKIYNLNRHGAYIDGTIPTEIATCKFQKVSDKTDILMFLKNNSQIQLLEEQQNYIKESINKVEILKEELIYMKNQKIKSYNSFLSLRDDMIKKIFVEFQAYNDLYLGELFKNYILVTEPYIFYCLNDKTRKNEVNLIKKVKKVWISHMISLCDKYIYYFNKLL